MRFLSVQIWLFWALQNSMAFEIPLIIENELREGIYRVVTLIPSKLCKTFTDRYELVDVFYRTFADFDSAEVERLKGLVAQGPFRDPIVKFLNDGYKLVYMRYDVLYQGLKKLPNKVVILKWEWPSLMPFLSNETQDTTLNMNDFTFYDRIVEFPQPSSSFGQVEATIQVGEESYRAQTVALVYELFHIFVPETIYPEFLRPLGMRLYDVSPTKPICVECDRVLRTKFPTISIKVPNKLNVWEITPTDYFVRKGDDNQCCLVLKSNGESETWRLGSAFIKIYSTVFRITRGRKFQFGLIRNERP